MQYAGSFSVATKNLQATTKRLCFKIFFFLKEGDEVTQQGGKKRIMTAWIPWDSNPRGKD